MMSTARLERAVPMPLAVGQQARQVITHANKLYDLDHGPENYLVNPCPTLPEPAHTRLYNAMCSLRDNAAPKPDVAGTAQEYQVSFDILRREWTRWRALHSEMTPAQEVMLRIRLNTLTRYHGDENPEEDPCGCETLINTYASAMVRYFEDYAPDVEVKMKPDWITSFLQRHPQYQTTILQMWSGEKPMTSAGFWLTAGQKILLLRLLRRHYHLRWRNDELERYWEAAKSNFLKATGIHHPGLGELWEYSARDYSQDLPPGSSLERMQEKKGRYEIITTEGQEAHKKDENDETVALRQSVLDRAFRDISPPPGFPCPIEPETSEDEGSDSDDGSVGDGYDWLPTKLAREYRRADAGERASSGVSAPLHTSVPHGRNPGLQNSNRSCGTHAPAQISMVDRYALDVPVANGSPVVDTNNIDGKKHSGKASSSRTTSLKRPALTDVSDLRTQTDELSMPKKVKITGTNASTSAQDPISSRVGYPRTASQRSIEATATDDLPRPDPARDNSEKEAHSSSAFTDPASFAKGIETMGPAKQRDEDDRIRLANALGNLASGMGPAQNVANMAKAYKIGQSRLRTRWNERKNRKQATASKLRSDQEARLKERLLRLVPFGGTVMPCERELPMHHGMHDDVVMGYANGILWDDDQIEDLNLVVGRKWARGFIRHNDRFDVTGVYEPDEGWPEGVLMPLFEPPSPTFREEGAIAAAR